MVSTTTKLMLVNDVAYELNITANKAKKVLDAVVNLMILKIQTGGELKIKGLGSFKKKTYTAKIKAPMMKEAEEKVITKILFKASKQLKEGMK